LLACLRRLLAFGLFDCPQGLHLFVLGDESARNTRAFVRLRVGADVLPGDARVINLLRISRVCIHVVGLPLAATVQDGVNVNGGHAEVRQLCRVNVHPGNRLTLRQRLRVHRQSEHQHHRGFHGPSV
jgi:hypothetical protein